MDEDGEAAGRTAVAWGRFWQIQTPPGDPARERKNRGEGAGRVGYGKWEQIGLHASQVEPHDRKRRVGSEEECLLLGSAVSMSLSCRLLPENSMMTEPLELPKRHSEGTFSNDYSKYLETRRAQDFVQWLKNSKRNGWVSPVRLVLGHLSFWPLNISEHFLRDISQNMFYKFERFSFFILPMMASVLNLNHLISNSASPFPYGSVSQPRRFTRLNWHQVCVCQTSTW